MNIIYQVIERMDLNKAIDVKSTISYIAEWLYCYNYNDMIPNRKYKNLSDDEYKDLYNMMEMDIYKTQFSFTQYDTNKKMVIIYFLRHIYNISYDCAKIIYNLYKNDNYSSGVLSKIINADKA